MMGKKDIVIPLLRHAIPGGYDPSLSCFEVRGPRGGLLIAMPKGAFNPKDGYLTRLINKGNTGIRHGRRGFHTRGAEKEFVLFSITLPDEQIVREILRYPWPTLPVVADNDFQKIKRCVKDGRLDDAIAILSARALRSIISGGDDE